MEAFDWTPIQEQLQQDISSHTQELARKVSERLQQKHKESLLQIEQQQKQALASLEVERKKFEEYKSQQLQEVETQKKELAEGWKMLDNEKKLMEQMHKVQKNQINLDVGGKHFSTSIETLTKEPNSLLESLFGGRYPIHKNEEGRVFIDRDGSVFDIILDYLRGTEIVMPTDTTVAMKLQREAKFYGLKGLEQRLLGPSYNVNNNASKKPAYGLFLVGGNDTDSTLATVERYDFDTKQSVTISAMKEARDGHCVVSTGHKIYAIGGTNLYSAEQYNPENNTWTKIATPLKPRQNFGAAVVGGKIYTLGSYKNTIEIYDPQTDTWALCDTLMTDQKYGFGITEYNGSLIIAGGHNVKESLAVVEQFDPRQKKWNILTPLPSPRNFGNLVAVQDRIYAIGGNQAKGTSKSVECCDLRTGKWIPVQSMHESREGAAAIACNGKIIVAGGQNSFFYVTRISKQLEEYDPQTNTWTVLPPLRHQRSHFGAAIL